jgi:hypothetical protein
MTGPLQVWWGPLPPRPSVPAREDTPIRIGDAERDTAVSDLGEHFAAGRLNRDEFDERADQAMQARFTTDLAPLFADLPTAARPAPTPPPGPRFGGPPPWASAMWLLPVMLVGLLVASVLLHAPFLLWGLIWMAVILRATGHRRAVTRGHAVTGPHGGQGSDRLRR